MEPIDSALLYRIVERKYGEEGILALEASCLTAADLEKGERHCLDAIQPALEEVYNFDL